MISLEVTKKLSLFPVKSGAGSNYRWTGVRAHTNKSGISCQRGGHRKVTMQASEKREELRKRVF